MKMYFIEANAPWKPAECHEVVRLGRRIANNGRRDYYIGVCAFECLHVANHHRRTRLRKFISNPYHITRHHDAWLAAKKALADLSPQ